MIAAAFLLAVAAAVAFWPAAPKKPAGQYFDIPAPLAPASPEAPAGRPHATCREALDHLVVVRERLQATGTLDDKARDALDTILLSLVHGSEL
jgi:hypothetical protein